MSGLTAAPAFKGDVQTFLVSGNWTKPTGLPDTALIIVELWGGGGGGSSRGGGGGGGGYMRSVFIAGNIEESVSVNVGAGGNLEAQGGYSSFGNHLRAYGGGRGNGGGGGGGSTNGTGMHGSSDITSTYIGAGGSGDIQTKGADGGAYQISAGSIGMPNFGGGGGQGYYSYNGGNAFFGGAGGQGKNYQTYGPAYSVFGGNGGNATNLPQVPGGGGSWNQTGASGMVKITVAS